VGAAVVAGHDLEILVTRASITVLVRDSSVGKMHLFVVVRQLMLTRPASDLLGLSIGSPVAVLAAAIVLLKEALVIPLELVVEDDSPDPAALLADALLGTLVSAINLGVVRQLARLLDARVKGLAGLVAAVVWRVAVGLHEVAAMGRQRDRALL
jgi:hypothetical protein